MEMAGKSAWKLVPSIICCVMALVVSGLLSEKASAESIVLAGSGTNLPAIRLLVKAFERLHPEIHFAEPTNIGSDGAVRAVADGAISIGLVSRALIGNEKNLGLTVVPYSRTAVAIGVNPSVKDEEITYGELNSIYRGDKTTWKDGNKIIVLNREPGESSILLLEENVPGFREVYRDSIKNNRWSIILKDEGMNRKIEAMPYSIGLTDMGAVTTQKLQIKLLKLNGVYPSAKTVINNTYPLYKTLAFVYRPERLTPGMKAYMAYVCSTDGKNILQNNGYVPYCVHR